MWNCLSGLYAAWQNDCENYSKLKKEQTLQIILSRKENWTSIKKKLELNLQIVFTGNF